MKTVNRTVLPQNNQPLVNLTKEDSPAMNPLFSSTTQAWLAHAPTDTPPPNRETLEQKVNEFVQQVRMQPLKVLMNPNAINTRTGRTPLHKAIADDDIQALKTLLKHPDINPNKASKFGCTPLYDAVFEGNIEIITALLDHPKTNPNLGDDRKNTPLHIAVSMSDYEVISLLLNHPKIVFNKRDKDGGTPLREAIYLKDSKAIKILKDYQLNIASKKEPAPPSAFEHAKDFITRHKAPLVSGALTVSATAISIWPYAARYFSAKEA